MNKFDSFQNIYTIYKKHIVTYKRNENNESEILSDYYKYIPVYGHYYNNNNHFICKKIFNHALVNEVYPNNFLIIKNNELARPYKGGIYIAKNMNDLYDILDKLKKYKKQNEES
jgi:hypothetical protein